MLMHLFILLNKCLISIQILYRILGRVLLHINLVRKVAWCETVGREGSFIIETNQSPLCIVVFACWLKVSDLVRIVGVYCICKTSVVF